MNIFKRKNITKKPWGEEEVIFEYYKEMTEAYEPPTKVKILRVKANYSLSKQYHDYKTEMMVCLKGYGRFEMNGITELYHPGFRIFITQKDVHRIIARFDSEFIELSNGYDADIIRLEDEYGRK